MVRAVSMVRRELFAGARDQIGDYAALARRIDLRRIVRDRSLHAALALAHLALAVAVTMVLSDVIGAMPGAALCLSAAAVALMLMLRAAEGPASLSRPERARADARPRTITDIARTDTLPMDGVRREVSGVLALMSHELRTPLNAILGNAEAIRHEILGPVGAARYRDSAVHILEGGQALLRATEDMLTLTSAVAAAAFSPHQPVDLETIVRDCLRQAGPEAKSKAVALSWQTGTDRAVLSEATALHHAVARIVSGALAQADAGAGIHVELTPCSGTVELMVTLTHGDAEAGARAAGRVDCGADRGPGALQVAVARTLVTLLGTHLHMAYGIDGRWRAIVELPAAPAS
ncbi:MAG: sensor histidine kinase [Hyphomicrobiaceae bacterium]